MLERPSLASEFFRRVQDEGVPFVKGLVQSSPPTFETDWLDFKGAARAPESDIKETWSKAIAGFANSGGGVLVWGIDARKDSDSGVDAASGLSLVANPDSFASRLKELQRQASDPPVMGIEYWSRLDDETSGCGYVVCLIPESDVKPHRAEYAGRNYYIRAGDSFVVPSVSLLRSLFVPGSLPSLAISISPNFDAGYSYVDVSLDNVGNATAEQIVMMIAYTDDTGWSCKLSENCESMHYVESSRKGRAALLMRFPSHPGATMTCFKMIYDRIGRMQLETPAFWCDVRIYCRNCPPLIAEFDMDGRGVIGRQKRSIHAAELDGHPHRG